MRDEEKVSEESRGRGTHGVIAPVIRQLVVVVRFYVINDHIKQ